MLCFTDMEKILNIFDNVKWTAAFEVTQYCNMACDICGANSGPNAPFKFLSADRIGNILAQVSKNPCFTHSYILSGGEVTTAYAYDRGYIGRLLQMGRDNKMRCTLRTNAKVFGKNLSALSDDLMPFAAMGRRAHKLLRIGLSLDECHRNSFDYNLRFIRTLTQNIDMPQRVFFIVSVGNAGAQLTDLAYNLGLPIVRNTDDGRICKIGNIDVQNEVNIYNAGRALENNIGNTPICDLATALSGIGQRGMIWFSVNNTAAFIYNFNTLLSTPLQNTDGTDKSVNQIMSDLRDQCVVRLGLAGRGDIHGR